MMSDKLSTPVIRGGLILFLRFYRIMRGYKLLKLTLVVNYNTSNGGAYMREFVGRPGIERWMKLVRGELNDISDWVSMIGRIVILSKIKVELENGLLVMDIDDEYRGPMFAIDKETGYLVEVRDET